MFGREWGSVRNGVFALSEMVGSIMEAIQSASDETLMMSRMNCHAFKLSSIVLDNNGGKLTRMFMAWPGHRLHDNTFPNVYLPVGIHDHRYDITLIPVVGFISNEVYEINTSGCRFQQYRFVSWVNSGVPSIERLDEVEALVRSNHKGGLLNVTQEMYAHELHTEIGRAHV